MNEDPLTSTGVQRAVKRTVADFLLEHLWKILSAIGGLVVGIVIGYSSIAVQISDLRASSTELRKTVEHLATRDQMDATNKRIDELVEWRLTFKGDIQEGLKLGPHPRKK